MDYPELSMLEHLRGIASAPPPVPQSRTPLADNRRLNFVGAPAPIDAMAATNALLRARYARNAVVPNVVPPPTIPGVMSDAWQSTKDFWNRPLKSFY